MTPPRVVVLPASFQPPYPDIQACHFGARQARIDRVTRADASVQWRDLASIAIRVGSRTQPSWNSSNSCCTYWRFRRATVSRWKRLRVQHCAAGGSCRVAWPCGNPRRAYLTRPQRCVNRAMLQLSALLADLSIAERPLGLTNACLLDGSCGPRHAAGAAGSARLPDQLVPALSRHGHPAGAPRR